MSKKKISERAPETLLDEQEELGICCPKCDGIRWRVKRTVPVEGRIMRLRICHKCGYRLPTYEAPTI